jgi:hypothetical protein
MGRRIHFYPYKYIMNGGLSPRLKDDLIRDLEETGKNVLLTGTGTAERATRVVKDAAHGSLNIANEGINTATGLGAEALKTTKVAGVEALKTVGDVGAEALKTTKVAGVEALGTTGALGAEALKTTKVAGEEALKTGEEALKTVGDVAKGTVSGIRRVGNIVGETGKATLERKQIRDEGARERSADNTKYHQEKKTAENKQLIEYKRKTDTELRNARDYIIKRCSQDMNSIPLSENYPLEKRNKHCKQMANCKIYGKKNDVTHFWHKNCSKLKKKMGNKVNDEDWLNNKWDNEWNYTPERQIEEPMPIAAAATGGKYTRKNIHKKHKKHKKTHKARTPKHNKSKKTGRKPMRKTRNHKNKHHQNKPKKH